jgi:hypothetical protein
MTKESGGTIFPAEQLGKAFDHYDMAHDGIADVTWVSPGYQPGRLVIATMGDGSYMFANPVTCHPIAEAMHLPVLVLFLKNRESSAVRQSVVGMYPDGYAARVNTMLLTSPSRPRILPWSLAQVVPGPHPWWIPPSYFLS